jgi:hypothetical protein
MGLSVRSFEVVDLVTHTPRNERVIMHENEEIVHNHGPTRIPVLFGYPAEDGFAVRTGLGVTAW